MVQTKRNGHKNVLCTQSIYKMIFFQELKSVTAHNKHSGCGLHGVLKQDTEQTVKS